MKARTGTSALQQQESKKGQSGALPSCSSSASTACCIPHPSFWLRLSIYCLLLLRAQVASTDLDLSNSVVNSVRRLGVDSSLLKYAFLALSSSDASSSRSSSSSSSTTVYNVTLTPFLRGIEAQAIRTDAKTLTQQGLTFNEFSVPQGAEMDDAADGTAGDHPLIVIYRKIFNFTVYSLPAQYDFAGPAVGIIMYSPANFTTADPSLPQLQITFPSSSRVTVGAPLSAAAQEAAAAGRATPMCAFFFPNGTVSFSATASMPNLCATDTVGSVDIAMVFPSGSSSASARSQQRGTSPGALADFPSSLPAGRAGRGHWKLALGATAVTLAGLAACVGLAIASAGLAEKVKVAILAHFADDEEALQTSLIGFSRAPTAGGVRTKPTLEMDMARF